MRPVRELSRLHGSLRRRLAGHQLALDGTSAIGNGVAEAVVVRATMDTLNSWSEFVRAYYLSCCLKARTAAGASACATPKPLPSPTAALEESIRIIRPKRYARGGPWNRFDEPTWRDPNTLVTLCSALAFTNAGAITVAFSISTNAFAHLPTFRNYFGHRNSDTAAAVGKLAPTYLSGARDKPASILRKQLPTTPRCVLADFLVDIGNVAEALCR